MDRTQVKVGNTAVLEMDGLQINVNILDTKSVYGRLDVQIEPVAGTGTKWVQCERLQGDNR
jgi:hypothetical protein